MQSPKDSGERDFSRKMETKTFSPAVTSKAIIFALPFVCDPSDHRVQLFRTFNSSSFCGHSNAPFIITLLLLFMVKKSPTKCVEREIHTEAVLNNVQTYPFHSLTSDDRPTQTTK